ncbi:MAG: hypothetical protein P1V51_14320 [Deltaproteobacteria bacterium]|nr:hypothetical protein [Deltaproteobacteria bacterium]
MGRLRASVATMNRVLVLGFAVVVVSAMLRWAITLHVLVPLLSDRPIGFEPGVASDLILAVYQQISLLIVLPGLAWAAGWIFDSRPLPLTLGAALFHEVWMGFVSYLGDGVQVFTARPLLVITKLVLAVGIAFLAARACAHAQVQLEAMSEDRRRKAPGDPAPGAGTIAPLSEEAIAAAKAALEEEAILSDDEVVPDEPQGEG